jgi:tetratricopeptide (TPR) repeat protein
MSNTSLNRSSKLIEEAVLEHQAGQLSKAEVLYRAALQLNPRNAFCNYSLGVLCNRSGRYDEALIFLKQAIEIDPSLPHYWLSYGQAYLSLGEKNNAITVYRKLIANHANFAEGYNSLGNALKASGKLEEALRFYERAVEISPRLAGAHFNIANIWVTLGSLDKAAISLERAIAIAPNFGEAHNHLGNILFGQGDLERAIAAYRRAIEENPGNAAAHNNLGMALKSAGRLPDAIESFRRASECDPNYAQAYNNWGIVLYDLGDFFEAEKQYRRALRIDPLYAEAYNNLGNALLREVPPKIEEAIRAYKSSIEISPEYIAPYDHLGVTLCERHQIAEGFEWFTLAAKRRNSAKQETTASEMDHKRAHDIEQRLYLSMGQSEELSGEPNIAHGDAISGPVINTRNVVLAESEWLRKRPQIIVIDNFLTEAALNQLRLFCLGSTIWRDVFAGGYLGARPESGFASPLLAQVADELRTTYSSIFRDYPLLYSWAFKYDSALGGTKIHADFAAINVNFWITPDHANLDGESGGLVIWDVAAPLDWNFEVYNRDEAKIRKFLADSGARSFRIPYRANRAVIFDSDLFHETDQMSFRSGYENRRINVTLLYGRRGQT